MARQLLADPDFGLDINDIDRVTFAMRAAGIPYVWPRAWSIAVRDAGEAEEAASQQFDAWLRTFHDAGERRCGLASESSQGSLSIAVVAADVVADVVSPLPTIARTGQWLTLGVELLEPADDAKVLLQGPTGEPVFVPTNFSGSTVHARFPMARPGPWVVQVMASTETGPRPVAEAAIFVDQEPPQQWASSAAPGESVSPAGLDPAASLFTMLNRARTLEGRKALRRSPELDAVARAHVAAMLNVGHVGHDVGDGSPKRRLEAAGLNLALAGENVVHAADAQRAHRALWASPSHRSNMLHRGFRNVGIGVVLGPDRTVWACELFAALD